MRDVFVAGGPGMIPTALFGLMLCAVSVFYAFRPERRFVPLQISLAIVTLTSGGLGFVAGLIKSLSAIGGVPPDKRFIWLIGMGESLNNLGLAFAALVLAALLASVGALRLALRSAPSS